MTSERMLPPMDIQQCNEDHSIQFYLSKSPFPTDESNNQFEYWHCPYDRSHKINSKSWRSHLQKCKKNYGGKLTTCPFNESHHVPEPEYEWHITTCPDRNIIRNEYEDRNTQLATQVNHNPDWDEPDTGESWEAEVDTGREEFTLDVNKIMAPVFKAEVLKNRCEENEENEVEDDQLEDGVESTDPTKWSEQQREDKLKAVKSKFPVAADKINASRFDFTSLLNLVCQKLALPLPVYEPCAGAYGGFSYRCRIKDVWYQGKEFCSSKKDAKHECAKWAILGMDIPGIDSEEDIPQPRTIPLHPNLLKQSGLLREGDEIGRLMAAGMYSTRPQQLRQPKFAPQQQQHSQQQTQQRQPNIQQQQQAGEKHQQQSHYQQQPQQRQQQQQKQVSRSMNSMAAHVEQQKQQKQQQEQQNSMAAHVEQHKQQQQQQQDSMAAHVEQQKQQQQQQQDSMAAHIQQQQQRQQKRQDRYKQPQMSPLANHLHPEEIQQSMSALDLNADQDVHVSNTNRMANGVIPPMGLGFGRGRGIGRGRGRGISLNML